MLIQVYARSVYGRMLVYPANAAAKALAAFAGVRTFNDNQIAALRSAGCAVEVVPDPAAMVAA